MGHIRLGRLPKSTVWNEVVELLEQAPEDVAGIAGAVLEASEADLNNRAALDAVADGFWILLRLAQSVDGSGVISELRDIGVSASDDTPLLRVLGDLGEELRYSGAVGDQGGHLREMAGLAMRKALLETVGAQGADLFESTAAQIEAGFRRWAGGERFGRVTQLYLGDFLARVLAAGVDRELSQHVGREGSYADVGDSRAFADALDRYGRETAGIARRFASDWYARNHWHLRRVLTRRAARRFSAVALRKLQSDLTYARQGST